MWDVVDPRYLALTLHGATGLPAMDEEAFDARAGEQPTGPSDGSAAPWVALDALRATRMQPTTGREGSHVYSAPLPTVVVLGEKRAGCLRRSQAALLRRLGKVAGEGAGCAWIDVGASRVRNVHEAASDHAELHLRSACSCRERSAGRAWGVHVSREARRIAWPRASARCVGLPQA